MFSISKTVLCLLLVLLIPINFAYSQEGRSLGLIDWQTNANHFQVTISAYFKQNGRLFFNDSTRDHRLELISDASGAYTKFEFTKFDNFVCSGEVSVKSLNWEVRTRALDTLPNLSDAYVDFYGSSCSLLNKDGTVAQSGYYPFQGTLRFKSNGSLTVCSQYTESIEILNQQIDQLMAKNSAASANNSALKQKSDLALARALTAERQNKLLLTQLTSLQSSYNDLKKDYEKLKKQPARRLR